MRAGRGVGANHSLAVQQQIKSQFLSLLLAVGQPGDPFLTVNVHTNLLLAVLKLDLVIGNFHNRCVDGLYYNEYKRSIRLTRASYMLH